MPQTQITPTHTHFTHFLGTHILHTLPHFALDTSHYTEGRTATGAGAGEHGEDAVEVGGHTGGKGVEARLVDLTVNRGERLVDAHHHAALQKHQVAAVAIVVPFRQTSRQHGVDEKAIIHGRGQVATGKRQHRDKRIALQTERGWGEQQ